MQKIETAVSVLRALQEHGNLNVSQAAAIDLALQYASRYDFLRGAVHIEGPIVRSKNGALLSCETLDTLIDEYIA